MSLVNWFNICYLTYELYADLDWFVRGDYAYNAYRHYTVIKIREKGAGPPSMEETGSRKKFPIILGTSSKIS